MKRHFLFYFIIIIFSIGLIQCVQSDEEKGNDCPLRSSYTEDADLCVCPENSTVDQQNKQCECNDGFTWDFALEKCVPDPKECTENATYNQETQNCDCNEGFTMVDGNCVVDHGCSEDQTYDETFEKCKCNEGLLQNGDACFAFNPEQGLHGCFVVAEVEEGTNKKRSYAVVIEPLTNQPDFIIISNALNSSRSIGLKLDEDRKGATFNEGTTIEGKPVTGGIKMDLADEGAVSNIRWNTDFGGVQIGGAFSPYTEGDEPCPDPNATLGGITGLDCICKDEFYKNTNTDQCLKASEFSVSVVANLDALPDEMPESAIPIASTLQHNIRFGQNVNPSSQNHRGVQVYGILDTTIASDVTMSSNFEKGTFSKLYFDGQVKEGKSLFIKDGEIEFSYADDGNLSGGTINGTGVFTWEEDNNDYTIDLQMTFELKTDF